MSALLYEHFVRKAFGGVERGGDPAGLAEADIYNSSNDGASLNQLKIGTGYAIAIHNADYMETKKLRDPDDYEKMDQFIADVLAAKNGNEISEVIEKYQKFQEELDNLPNIF